MVTVALGSETLDILRPAATDPFGDPSGGGTEFRLEDCSVQPRSSTEDTAGRDTVIAGYTVWAPAGSDVRSSDRVRWRGEVYAIEGRPGLWPDVDGSEHHVQFAIRLVTG